MIRDLIHALAADTRHAAGAALTPLRALGNWALGPQMDDVVCDWANKTDQEQP